MDGSSSTSRINSEGIFSIMIAARNRFMKVQQLPLSQPTRLLATRQLELYCAREASHQRILRKLHSSWRNHSYPVRKQWSSPRWRDSSRPLQARLLNS